MNAREEGFLLLASSLGDPDRHPLTVPQLRNLAKRVQSMMPPSEDRELQQSDLLALGYNREMSERILRLLGQNNELSYYLQKANRFGCIPITRVSQGYPHGLRRLQLDAPGALWAKGDLSILSRPMVSLVGSRDIRPANERFAAEVGRQAALQGYVLVSGNARGSDRIAQDSCLSAGGYVVIVAADSLEGKRRNEHILYLCEDSFDLPFSPQRALSRNRVIHCLGSRVFVAQCGYKTGGTWSGTEKNLSCSWSPVFCYDDNSDACLSLAQMGATKINLDALSDFSRLEFRQDNFFAWDEI